jgi:hypothetical protein
LILILVWMTVSNAFWKSTKQANTLPSLELQYVSIILAFLVNPKAYPLPYVCRWYNSVIFYRRRPPSKTWYPW